MMRIAYMLDGFDIGGTELHAVRLVEALVKSASSHVELYVAHLHADGPLFDRYRALGIPMLHLPIGGLLRPASFLQGIALARQLRAWHIDVFHSHDVYGNIFGVPWARAARTPLVVASRRWWDSLPRPGLAVLNRRAYGLSHYVVANSPSVGRLLQQQEAIAASKVVTLENFLADAAFAQPSVADITQRRRALGLGVDDFVIGMVARLSPVKNAAMLLRAAARVLPEFPHACVALAGDGPERAALERLAATLGISARVHFLGTQPNQPSAHGLFDVSVLTSDSEGFPNSIVEALALGRPVVATRVGGVPDVIDDEGTGLLVARDDDEAMAHALRRLLEQPALREQLATRGRARARERFHERHAIAALLDFYRRALERR